MECIAYKAGYRYQLAEEYMTGVGIYADPPIETDWLSLDADGLLTIRKGYAWDGPSGPALDTLNFMRGSLIHDALYQMIREGHLDRSYRDAADRVLRQVCLEDGMSRLRAWWVYIGVRLGGGPAADPAHRRPILRAPRRCQGVQP